MKDRVFRYACLAQFELAVAAAVVGGAFAQVVLVFFALTLACGLVISIGTGAKR